MVGFRVMIILAGYDVDYPGGLIETMGEVEVRQLCLCLLYKRKNDGLNSRTWDARKHQIWENQICNILKRHNQQAGTENRCECADH